MNTTASKIRSQPSKKRSIMIDGHKTSVSLEHDFWDALAVIAEAKRMTLRDLVALIDDGRTGANLSSAIRMFVLKEARAGRLGPRSTEPRERRLRRVSDPR